MILEGIEQIAISLMVNGQPHDLQVPVHAVLADILRDILGLTGCKIGCDQAVCGACTVLADGLPLAACATFAFAVDGRQITTIEALAPPGSLADLQAAFLRHGALQCGFCTPGMVLAATSLLATNRTPDNAAIRAGLAGNLCRCTGYKPIIAAIQDVAAQRSGAA